MRETDSNLSLPDKLESLGGSLRRLKDERGLGAEDILTILENQSVEIVLTAHPTEVNRRTMLRKHQNVEEILSTWDRSSLLNYERRDLERSLQREIGSIWDSDALRRSKPSPVEEAKAGLAIVESVLWKAIPSYLRKVNDVTEDVIGRSLPLHIKPIKVWFPSLPPSLLFCVCVCVCVCGLFNFFSRSPGRFKSETALL